MILTIKNFVQLTEVASFFECDLKLTSSKDLTVLAWVGLDTISEIYEKVEILSIFFIVEFFFKIVETFRMNVSDSKFVRKLHFRSF